ncbi:MAG: carbon-nitrogen hydrolase family protein [Pseudomonadota bacterium]
MKLSIIQMNVGNDKQKNLQKAERLVTTCVAKEAPDWIALPEMFDYAGSGKDKRAQAEILGEGTAYKFAQNMAKKHGVFVHAGSFHEWRESEQRIANTTVVFNGKGDQVALYRKIHLFDITAPDGTRYFESEHIAPGNDVVTYACGALTFGCAICYDLRFPDLFQALRLKGADLIALPSAFTQATGRAHWETLLRARAIEAQCFIAAPAQTGSFMQDGGTRQTHGHSMIVNAWGDVIAKMNEGEGYVVAQVDAALLENVRKNMPVMRHRKFAAPHLEV